jgi:hypothetical protein
MSLIVLPKSDQIVQRLLALIIILKAIIIKRLGQIIGQISTPIIPRFLKRKITPKTKMIKANNIFL